MAIQIQYRRGLSADWTSANPLLAEGEPGYETDTGRFKVGNGTTYWNDLIYVSGANLVSATPPASPRPGDVWFSTTNGKTFVYYDGYWIESAGDVGPEGPTGPTGPQGSKGTTGDTGPFGPKSISILAPTNAENITLFYTTSELEISQISSAIRGGTSVTFTIRYGTNRSDTGTQVITGGTVANSTTGLYTTSFTNAIIPSNSWVWLLTTAVSGTVNELAVTIEFVDGGAGIGAF